MSYPIDLGGTDLTVNTLSVGATTPGAVGTNITSSVTETTVNSTNLNAGASGTAGTLKIYPTTASKGDLKVVATANTGNTETTVTNAAMGQASVISIPDPGASTANFLLDTGTNGTATIQALHIDAGTKTATATSGAATLSKYAGVVTSEALTTAAGATYALTLTNTTVAAADQVFASVNLGTATTGMPAITTIAPAAGSVVITVQNIHASAALNGTIKIAYNVIKN